MSMFEEMTSNRITELEKRVGELEALRQDIVAENVQLRRILTGNEMKFRQEVDGLQRRVAELEAKLA